MDYIGRKYANAPPNYVSLVVPKPVGKAHHLGGCEVVIRVTDGASTWKPDDVKITLYAEKDKRLQPFLVIDGDTFPSAGEGRVNPWTLFCDALRFVARQSGVASSVVHPTARELEKWLQGWHDGCVVCISRQ